MVERKEEPWRLIPFVTPDEVKDIIREERRYIPGGTVTVSREEVEAAMKAAARAKRLASMLPVAPAKIHVGAQESSAIVKMGIPASKPMPREMRMATPKIQKCGGYLVPDRRELVYEGPVKIHGAESLHEVPEPTPIIEAGPQKIRTKIVDFTPGLTKTHIFEEIYEAKKKAGS